MILSDSRRLSRYSLVTTAPAALRWWVWLLLLPGICHGAAWAGMESQSRRPALMTGDAKSAHRIWMTMTCRISSGRPNNVAPGAIRTGLQMRRCSTKPKSARLLRQRELPSRRKGQLEEEEEPQQVEEEELAMRARMTRSRNSERKLKNPKRENGSQAADREAAGEGGRRIS